MNLGELIDELLEIQARAPMGRLTPVVFAEDKTVNNDPDTIETYYLELEVEEKRNWGQPCTVEVRTVEA